MRRRKTKRFIVSALTSVQVRKIGDKLDWRAYKMRETVFCREPVLSTIDCFVFAIKGYEIRVPVEKVFHATTYWKD